MASRSDAGGRTAPKLFSLRLMAVFFGLIVGITLLGWVYLKISKDRIRTEAGNELQTISALKTAQLVQWRQERLADARVLSENALLADIIATWRADPTRTDLERDLRQLLESLNANYFYSAAHILDPQGRVLMAVLRPGGVFVESDHLLALKSLSDRAVLLSDLYRDPGRQKVHQELYIPILGSPQDPPTAIVVLQIDPELYLYPMLQSWPTPSRSAESLLVRREGGEVVYLNELRHRRDTALNLRLPVDAIDLPAAAAVRGVTGIVKGVDYDGRTVMASLRPVQGSNWFLVCKVESVEIYRPFQRLAWMAGLVMLALVLLSALWTHRLWKRQQDRWQFERQEDLRLMNADLERRVAEQTEEIRKSYDLADRERQKLYAVLETLPAYVVLLTPDYHVPFANRVFRERFGEPRGRRCYEFLFGRTEPCETCETYTVLKTGKQHHWEWTGPDAREYDVHDFPFTDTDGSPLILEMGLDVTERKHAEAALKKNNETLEQRVAERTAEVRESERRYRSLFEGMTEGFALHEIITDAEGKPVDYRFLEINPAFERLTGIKREDVVGRTVLEVLPATEPHWIETYGRVAQTGEAVHFNQFHGGLGRHYDVFAYRPAPGQFAVLFMDITMRKQAEDALRESELRLSRAQELAHLGSWELDLTAGQLSWSDEVYRIFGLKPQEFEATYEAFLERVHPEDRAAVNDAYTASIQEGRNDYEIEHRIIRAGTGEIRTVHEKCQHFRDAAGRVVRSTGMVHDITERKRAEEALRRSEARFRIALQNSPITVAAIDGNLRYTWVYNTRHGFDPGEVVGRRPDELIPPEDAAEITAFLERALASGTPARGTVSGRTRGESWVYDISSEPLPGGEGDGMGLMIAMIDITDRTRMERDLMELETFKLRERSQKEWQATVDHITDMISIHDRNGAILKANKAFRDYFGLSTADLEGKRCFTIFNRKGIPLHLCPMKTSILSGSPEFTEISEGPGGRILEASAFPFASSDGRPEGCIHVLKDVTARKESEMQLIMNERLAALGQMAAGIAHEINNPLATISGCAEGLMNRTRKGQMDPALFADYLGIIDEEIVRCKAITSSMLSFVRRGDPQRQTLNAREVMDRTLELIGFQGRLRNVDLLKNYASWVEPIHAAETEVKQVFAALLANALDSMRDAGRLVVAMDDIEGTIRITVQDSGPGIPAGITDRIFDPFFTTKQGEGGTGLGLPIARRIVESIGGTLEVSSPPGEGAIFTITLPRA